MNADVRHPPAGADQLGCELERLGNADRLERDVGAQTIGQLHDPRDGVLAAVVDRGVRAELKRALKPAVGEIDRHYPGGGVELCRQDASQANRAGAHDRHHVPGRDHAVEDAHLEGGGQDVGQEQDLFVAELVGQLVHRVVGERNARVLGLQPVDQMAEDPPPPPRHWP